MFEKTSLEEMRDQLLNIRNFCTKELNKNIKLINENDGKINDLISTAEKMVMMQNVEKIKKEPDRQKEMLKELKEKFKRRS